MRKVEHREIVAKALSALQAPAKTSDQKARSYRADVAVLHPQFRKLVAALKGQCFRGRLEWQTWLVPSQKKHSLHVEIHDAFALLVGLEACRLWMASPHRQSEWQKLNSRAKHEKHDFLVAFLKKARNRVTQHAVSLLRAKLALGFSLKSGFRGHSRRAWRGLAAALPHLERAHLDKVFDDVRFRLLREAAKRGNREVLNSEAALTFSALNELIYTRGMRFTREAGELYASYWRARSQAEIK